MEGGDIGSAEWRVRRRQIELCHGAVSIRPIDRFQFTMSKHRLPYVRLRGTSAPISGVSFGTG